MQRSRINQFLQGLVLLGEYALCAALFSSPIFAQPPASNPNEMCGDGTTFTVELVGTKLGIDDSDGLFQSINVPEEARPDSVTLPNGCRIYAIFVSGYANNWHYDDIPFYKVAEFVAKHNGYVHVGWWNNFTKEYAAGPLHPEDIVIRRLFGLFPDETIKPTPALPATGGLGGLVDVTAFAPALTLLDRPKANPDDDFQFQSDAADVIKAIRAHNPNAIIVVAGHSMGGNAVARLGLDSDAQIDLLAPIDPVGNRDKPRGILGQRNFNWTRWRVANEFRGYKRWNCERNSFGLCRDFDPRLFHASFNCFPVGEWLEVRPLITTLAPLACPYLAPYIDPGTRRTIGPNIKHLYHRWQHENIWPVDFPQTERFNHWHPLSPSGFILGPNYQHPVLPNLNPLSLDPDKTCPFPEALQVPDPRDPSFTCAATDGHGEVIGQRGFKGLLMPGLKMEDWPGADIPLGILNSAARRAKIIELATADENWPHRPQNPDLCMVCDDMITILQHLLAQQPSPPSPTDTTPPVTLAIANPGPGPVGWNNEDVIVNISAVDEQNGSGVELIETEVSGAQFGGMLTTGSVAQESVTAEGKTVVSYFARDNAGNAETAQMLNVWIDKTSPMINAVTVEPNGNGWLKNAVLVSFPASDEVDGSGLASSTADVAVSTEGANQEINGTAEDNAGNTASASVILNLDLTAPGITFASRTPAANAEDWNNSDVTFTWNCTDALSGPASPSVTQSVTAEGAAQTVTGACMDLADNTASDTQVNINLDKTKPTIHITTPADGATYLLNAAVNSNYSCTDSVSGVESCSGPVASGSGVNTSAVGDQQFLVNSGDRAGNQASSTHNYAVHYDFPGFGNPIGPMPMLNVVKAGRVVPVKYVLQDANGALLSDLRSFVSLTSVPVACDASAPVVPVEESGVAGNTGIHYDADSGQFIYNWKTDASWAGTCRAAQLTLNDGTRHLALFQFK